MQRGSGIKIGVAKDINRRNKTFATAGPDPIFVIGRIKRGGYELEGNLHKQFEFCHIEKAGVGTEWFRPHPELVLWMLTRGIIPRPNIRFIGAFLYELFIWIFSPGLSYRKVRR